MKNLANLTELAEYLSARFSTEKMIQIVCKASDERIEEMLEENGIW